VNILFYDHDQYRGNRISPWALQRAWTKLKQGETKKNKQQVPNPDTFRGVFYY